MNDKILITGGLGQLGAELYAALSDKVGAENIVLTDIKAPEHLPRSIQFEPLDTLDEKALHACIEKNRITIVYHLAAMLSATGEKNPVKAWHLNMDSLLYVLEASVKYKLKRVFWPSSIAVFGPTTPKDHTPQHTLMEPTTIYGISKLAGEGLCSWYHEHRGVDVRSLRYPGLIGYKSQPGGGTTDYAVEVFFKALHEKPYSCYLKPNTYLPMMYMDDAIRATLQFMDAPPEHIRIRTAYNLTGMSFSPEEIAAEIKKSIPNFTIQYEPDLRQGIAESWPRSIDDGEAQKDWGWKPRYGLQEMVREILKKMPAHYGLAPA